jgi:pimeloyl-ACP methyl ester carboxylesterase
MKKILRASAFALLLLLVIVGVTFYANPIGVADESVRFELWRKGVHSRYIEVDGYRIHYFEAGPANGTPLVLIHGLGSRGEDWAPLLPPLATNGFHLYVPDLLGYGRSPTPDIDYSIASQVKLVADFMRAANVPKADVGGWSMGGWVAAKLTIDHPELVDRLVLYDSAGIYFPATFDASLFTPTDRAGLIHLTEMLQPFPQPLPGFIAQAAIEKLQRGAWVITRSVNAMTSGRDLLDFRLSTIHRPTLIVWGTKDVLIPPSVGESMHHLIQDSSMTLVEGCGHLAPAQCTAPVLATTLQFLKADPPLKNQEQTLPGH